MHSSVDDSLNPLKKCLDVLPEPHQACETKSAGTDYVLLWRLSHVRPTQPILYIIIMMGSRVRPTQLIFYIAVVI